MKNYQMMRMIGRGGQRGGKRGTEEIGGKSRKRGMTIVSMASEIGTNVVSLHFVFCHWNKL